jgi:uncharacterized protein YciI
MSIGTDTRPPNRSELLGRDYWLIWSTPTKSTTAQDIEATLDEHLRWLLGLEADGIILLSGPLLSGPDVGPGSGVTVLRANSEQHARAIAENDPFVTAGLRSIQVLRWRVNEGSIGIRLSLGTGGYSWD